MKLDDDGEGIFEDGWDAARTNHSIITVARMPVFVCINGCCLWGRMRRRANLPSSPSRPQYLSWICREYVWRFERDNSDNRRNAHSDFSDLSGQSQFYFHKQWLVWLVSSGCKIRRCFKSWSFSVQFQIYSFNEFRCLPLKQACFCYNYT